MTELERLEDELDGMIGELKSELAKNNALIFIWGIVWVLGLIWVLALICNSHWNTPFNFVMGWVFGWTLSWVFNAWEKARARVETVKDIIDQLEKHNADRQTRSRAG